MKRSTDKFDYMLLDRMRTDCEYFMTYGGRNVKFLWAKDVDEQIEKMWELWHKCRPQWLTNKQLKDIEKRMKGLNHGTDTF